MATLEEARLRAALTDIRDRAAAALSAAPIPEPAPAPVPAPTPTPPPAPAPTTYKLQLGYHFCNASYWKRRYPTFKPNIPVGPVRIHDGWDMDMPPERRTSKWEHIETSAGVFNWQLVREHIAAWKSWGATDFLFVICHTPPFLAVDADHAMPPKDKANWTRWCKTMLIEMKAQGVKYVSPWNEPGSWPYPSKTVSYFWHSTPTEMAWMTRDLKAARDAVAPEIVLLSPECHGNNAGWMDAFGAAGGYFGEVQAFHAYGEGANADAIVQSNRMSYANYEKMWTKYNVASQPRWMTESGWDVNLHGGKMTKVEHLQKMVALSKEWKLARHYHYGLDVDIGRVYTLGSPPSTDAAMEAAIKAAAG